VGEVSDTDFRVVSSLALKRLGQLMKTGRSFELNSDSGASECSVRLRRRIARPGIRVRQLDRNDVPVTKVAQLSEKVRD
jgi:hypothetical protein